MPEGPEVKTTVDFLKTYVNKTIKSFTILSGRYAKKGSIENDSHADLPAIIKSVDCKGKFIYFTLSHDNKEYYLFSTLGMTGMWSNKMTKHARFLIAFNDDLALYYNDMRNFGTLKFVLSKTLLDKKLNSLGPDMLSESISDAAFKSRLLRKENKTVVEAIMDQSVVSGVGNYLKSESLYAAGIKPSRKIKSLTDAEFSNLNKCIQSIIRTSYKSGGATIKNYRQPNGKAGNFSRRFAVYNCKTDPYNNIIIKEKTKDGRSTFWVPQLQK